MNNFSKVYFPLLLSVLFLSGCALQLPPSGGEIDKVPPEIVYAYPDDGTLEYHKDFIEFEFSEYVDKRKFKDALFISPAIEGELDISWTNTTVTVTFPEKLRENKTYTITVGTDVTDLHNNNRMASSHTLRFSTGSKIDNGVISGQVYDAKAPGTMIYVYSLDSIAKGPDKVKPEYATQVGVDSNFTITGISEGTYRVLAMRDEFKDFLFQPDQDAIGITYKDVTLSLADSVCSGLTFHMQKIDTVYPRLLTSVMTDKKHILLTFSEEIDFRALSPKNFTLFDSVSGAFKSVGGCFKGRTKEKEFVLVVPDTQSISQNAFIIAARFTDLFGNTSEGDTVSLVVTEKPDTTNPSLWQVTPQRNAADVNFQNMRCLFQFDDMVSADSSVFVLRDTLKRVVKTRLTKNDDALFTLLPMEKLKPFTDYETVVNGSVIKDPAGNYIDTTIVTRFKTMNDIDFTGVFGKVTGWDSTKTAILRFSNISDTSVYYQIPLQKNGVYGVKNMLPGKYSILFYYDANKNGVWENGTLQPFSFAEQGMQLRDILVLTPRWSVTDYSIDVSFFTPKDKK